MWVKARGSVQNDTFVRDLVMIANDINEITGPSRKDKSTRRRKTSRVASPYSDESNGRCHSSF